MTNVTEVLGDESGVQYQGVNDASGGNGAYPTIGLMVGEFRRGRLDKPMTITSQNIRALLGYDPENLAYVAVQDVLNTGVPSVQVLRMTEPQGENIDYTGEYPTSNGVITFKLKDLNDKILIQINDVNIIGSVYEIMDKLAEEYEVYMTYVYPNILLFTNSGLGIKNIVIRGVQSYIENINDLDITWANLKNDYCQVIKVDEQTYAFSLIETRMGFISLLNVEAELNDKISVTYANKAMDVINNNSILNQVELTRWYSGIEEIFPETIVNFTLIPHVPFSVVMANPSANDSYQYFYKKVVKFSFAKALAKYSENEEDNRIRYNSNSGYFYADSAYFMDVGMHTVKGRFIKGYPAYLSMPM
ncbi:hypothetical protein [Acinetobacter bereziniae]|uniref:hypothetical protein n=1 Tax=Acinetobacter bereziniae TaxID=106648 RepID=UPI001C0650BE|nr:hypothetical protein [Acinetobacter bereziniae]